MSEAGESGADQPPGSQDAGRRYVVAGLEVLGVEAEDDEIAVIQAVHAIYGPALEGLMAEGFDDVPQEPGADMSRAPGDPMVR
jgi:hypothetical protein